MARSVLLTIIGPGNEVFVLSQLKATSNFWQQPRLATHILILPLAIYAGEWATLLNWIFRIMLQRVVDLAKGHARKVR